jgi:hypothetical protein
VNRLSKEFGVELAAATLFERPTVSEFAELLAVPDDGDSATAPPSQVDNSAARGERRRARTGAAAMRARKTRR